jgi:hypothetical protein
MKRKPRKMGKIETKGKLKLKGKLSTKAANIKV